MSNPVKQKMDEQGMTRETILNAIDHRMRYRYNKGLCYSFLHGNPETDGWYGRVPAVLNQMDNTPNDIYRDAFFDTTYPDKGHGNERLLVLAMLLTLSDND